jgi:hypothetical protein
MKRSCLICIFLCLTATFLMCQPSPAPLVNPSTSVVSPVSASQADAKAQARILDRYGKLPLSFEANQGQTDGRVKFLSRTAGYSLFLIGDEAVLALSAKKPSTDKSKVAGHKSAGVLRMKLSHANPAAKVTGVDELAGTSNYFIGNDPAKWRTNVPTYAKVKYEGIYSGIDLVYYGNQRQLEYDFIVAPGADPRRIALDVRGAKRIRQNALGELVFEVGEEEIRWHKPVVYQEEEGTRREIAAHYVITGENRFGFELAKYDASRTLYIDPLIYSTFLGGSSNDGGAGIAVDSAGNAYITGFTQSTNFPTTGGAFDPACSACNPFNPDAFVSKFDPTGSALVYSTYLGGSALDAGYGIAVDGAGNAYVSGFTKSTDFPTTAGAFLTTCSSNSCVFVSKIDSAGSALSYSTYLGNSGCYCSSGIAVDSAGNAYVAGMTGPGFPTTPGAFQTTFGGGDWDAFVTKLNPTGSALVYATFLGGSGEDSGSGIALDSSGDAYVTGWTGSTNFPMKGPLQPAYSGDVDAFVSEFNPSGSALVYSTYLGGSGVDEGTGIAVDTAGSAYVTGVTYSNDFPTTPRAFQTVCDGGTGCSTYGDAFVSKLKPSGSALVYSTYLGGTIYPGGNSDASGTGIAVDRTGDAYVVGWTTSTNFPQVNPVQPKLRGDSDAFVSKLNPTGTALFFSSYLGGGLPDFGSGVALDGAGNAYVTGDTESGDFPTKNPFQAKLGGFVDAFVTKIDVMAPSTTVISSSQNPSALGQAVVFTAAVTSNGGVPPNGEIVSFMKGTTVLGTAELSGGSARLTISTLPLGDSQIKGVYNGDSNLVGSKSKWLTQAVSKATTTTTLASSLNPSKVGQSVTFTATVAPQFTGSVTGSVTFYDGTTVLKTVSVSGGTAKITTKTLAAGVHSITATYHGSTDFDGSASAPLTRTTNVGLRVFRRRWETPTSRFFSPA